MLSAILEWSLRHRVLVIIAWLGVIVAGVLAALRLPLDAFPDTTPVQVQVNTGAGALGPLEIERRITARVEASLGGLPGLTEVRSVSKFGFSQVTATFTDGTDILRARQVVSERLMGVELDPGLGPPELGPIATGLGEVFHYIVSGDRSAAELRTIQDYDIRPRLRMIEGVAELNSWGGDEARVEVRVDPNRLRRWDIDLVELTEAVERNSLNVTGGPIDTGGEGALIQGIALATTKADLEALVIASREGVPVRLGQVAEVVDGRQVRRGAVTADGKGEVVLGLGFSMLGENGRAVTERLELRLAEIKRTLPADVRVTTAYERTWIVDSVLETVRDNLLEGAVLVIAILFLFLGNVRAGLLVAAVIPLSMLVASSLMLAAGVAGSLMSLGAIDFGIIVDSAVIQVENVVARGSGVPAPERPKIVRDAILEVRGPTLYGELIIAAVFLPILVMEGVEGKLFRPMALTMLFALLGSLLLSLTLVPALSTFVVPKKAHRPNRVFSALIRGYRAVLRFGLRQPVVVLGLALLVLGNGAFLVTQLGSEFVPRLSEGSIVINTVRLAGVSIDQSAGYGTRIEAFLLAHYPKAIARIWTRSGSAEVTTDPMGVEVSDVFIMLRPRDEWLHDGPGGFASQDALVADMTRRVDELPGMRAAFTQPIEMRVNEMIAGIRSDLGVLLYGDDFAVLAEKARAIEEVLKTVPGAADVSTEQLTGQPVVEVVFDPVALGRHGIEVHDALAVVEALGGIEVGVMPQGERRIPIAVVLDERYRGSPEALGQALVTAGDGQRVPLATLAKLTRVDAPSTIQRELSRRRVIIQANVRDRDLGGFVADARAAIAAQVPLPDGYYVTYGGQFEHLQRASERLVIVIPIALGLVLLLLGITYRKVGDVLRVFVGVPFAAVGGVVALWLRDMPFSISAAVGFIALAGVSVLNNMVLVSTIRRRLADGDPVPLAVEAAAAQRLRPVLMTALVASLGFVPMALATGIGAEVQRPLATVVVGGVLSSTLLALLVLPVLYRVTSGSRAREPSVLSPIPGPAAEGSSAS